MDSQPQPSKSTKEDTKTQNDNPVVEDEVDPLEEALKEMENTEKLNLTADEKDDDGILMSQWSNF